jgi:hypothetical protein
MVPLFTGGTVRKHVHGTIHWLSSQIVVAGVVTTVVVVLLLLLLLLSSPGSGGGGARVCIAVPFSRGYCRAASVSHPSDQQRQMRQTLW